MALQIAMIFAFAFLMSLSVAGAFLQAGLFEGRRRLFAAFAIALEELGRYAMFRTFRRAPRTAYASLPRRTSKGSLSPDTVEDDTPRVSARGRFQIPLTRRQKIPIVAAMRLDSGGTFEEKTAPAPGLCAGLGTFMLHLARDRRRARGRH